MKKIQTRAMKEREQANKKLNEDEEVKKTIKRLRGQIAKRQEGRAAREGLAADSLKKLKKSFFVKMNEEVAESQRPLEIGDIIEWKIEIAKNMDHGTQRVKGDDRQTWILGQKSWGSKKGEVKGFTCLGSRDMVRVVWNGDLETSLVPLECVQHVKISK